jgi:hypothetical protein
MLEHDIHRKEIYELNEQQNQRIDVALGQIERGETYTELEADKITNDWLEQLFQPKEQSLHRPNCQWRLQKTFIIPNSY